MSDDTFTAANSQPWRRPLEGAISGTIFAIFAGTDPKAVR